MAGRFWDHVRKGEFQIRNMRLEGTSVIAVSGFTISLLTAKLFKYNFHPLEVVSRWRDPQLQVSEWELFRFDKTTSKSCLFMSRFIFTILQSWYVMC